MLNIKLVPGKASMKCNISVLPVYYHKNDWYADEMNLLFDNFLGTQWKYSRGSENIE